MYLLFQEKTQFSVNWNHCEKFFWTLHKKCLNLSLTVYHYSSRYFLVSPAHYNVNFGYSLELTAALNTLMISASL